MSTIYIIIYIGLWKELINYKGCIENIMEIYTEHGLDITKYIHKSIQKNAYYICQKDKIHTIIFNDEPIEIPIDMDVSEFQIYSNSYIDICPIVKTVDNTFESSAAYFLDETFTANKKYTNNSYNTQY